MPQNLSTSVPNDPTIMLVGGAGSGKTTFMTRFVYPGKRIYIIDCDKNLAGPQKVMVDEKRDLKLVDFDHLDLEDDMVTPVPMTQRYLRFAKLIKNALAATDTDGKPLYPSIGLTSTTTFSEVLKGEVCRQKNLPEGSKFDFSHWDQYAWLWTFVINTFRACNRTVIIDAHEKTEKGDMDQVLRYVLAIQGQTGDLMPMKVTDFWRMQVETKLENGKQVPRYMVNNLQDDRHPNYKTSLRLPAKFEATQDMATAILKQVHPELFQ